MLIDINIIISKYFKYYLMIVGVWSSLPNSYSIIMNKVIILYISNKQHLDPDCTIIVQFTTKCYARVLCDRYGSWPIINNNDIWSLGKFFSGPYPLLKRLVLHRYNFINNYYVTIILWLIISIFDIYVVLWVFVKKIIHL